MKKTLIASTLALASTLAVSAAPTGEPAEVICHKIRGTGGYEKEYKPDRTWCNPGPMSPYLGACRVTIVWVDEATWTAMSCVYNAVD